MNEINTLVQDAEAHKAAATVVGMWVMRETPLVYNWIRTSLWPSLVSIYPYCRDNGGVGGIIKYFFWGKPALPPKPVVKQTTKENDNEKVNTVGVAVVQSASGNGPNV